MSTVVTVRAVVSGATHDLRRWLAAEDSLRGRVRLADTRPVDGAMGAVSDVLVAVLEPGGVAAVFVGGVVAWLQARRGDQTVTLTRPDGTRITIESTQVRGLNGEQAMALAERLSQELTAAEPERRVDSGESAQDVS
ncbi:hypothetical protein ACFU76_37205 [Streptomyces sp. NPDC057539]|uniref:effector-associated constant component EACC1 n=1 Tax=unclassified Streptomyces TaxID=2593676 RepID=UPI00201EAC78|nr:hypothetical protein [Streptomyces sp. 35G-GA-8]MCL7382419.1 hypothetical protein [Streptomyces sp. 35G-GA-8]